LTEAGGHPRHRLSPRLNSPIRLSIATALLDAGKVEFAYIRDLVEITDAHLSKQIALMEADSLLRVQKGYVGRRPRTWLSLTAKGRRVLAEHLDALAEITRSASQDADPAARPGARV
jgi:DNA-binding MarR family transcriptional regulator